MIVGCRNCGLAVEVVDGNVHALKTGGLVVQCCECGAWSETRSDQEQGVLLQVARLRGARRRRGGEG